MQHRNFRRTVRGAREEDGWALWPLLPHEFRFLIHFARLGPGLDQVRAHGLAVERVWSSDGEPIDPAAERTTAEYVHVVARKAG